MPDFTIRFDSNYSADLEVARTFIKANRDDTARAHFVVAVTMGGKTIEALLRRTDLYIIALRRGAVGNHVYFYLQPDEGKTLTFVNSAATNNLVNFGGDYGDLKPFKSSGPLDVNAGAMESALDTVLAWSATNAIQPGNEWVFSLLVFAVSEAVRFYSVQKKMVKVLKKNSADSFKASDIADTVQNWKRVSIGKEVHPVTHDWVKVPYSKYVDIAVEWKK